MDLPDDSGAPEGFCKGSFDFTWRDCVASRIFLTKDWPQACSMAIEKHPSALDYTCAPFVYLVSDFDGSDIRVMLKPYQRPIFENAAGFLISYGAWPRLTEGKPSPIFATRASEVYDVFKWTEARRKRRLRLDTRLLC